MVISKKDSKFNYLGSVVIDDEKGDTVYIPKVHRNSKKCLLETK